MSNYQTNPMYGNANYLTIDEMARRIGAGESTARDEILFRHYVAAFTPQIRGSDIMLAVLQQKWAEDKRREIETEMLESEKVFKGQMLELAGFEPTEPLLTDDDLDKAPF